MRVALRVLLAGYDHLVIYFNVAWLGIQCLAWTPIALIVNPLLSERRGRALGRYFLMVSFRSYLGGLALSRRFRFDLKDLDALRGEPPMIIAPNHPCLLDALLVISRLPNVACVLRADLMNSVFFGAGARLARFIRNEPVRDMVRSAIRDFDCGSHLLLFPEGTRTISNPVNPFKGSIGLIARHAQVPVQTILIETDSRYMGKNWSVFRMPRMPIHYRVRLGRRFDPPQNAQIFMAELEHYFARELVQGTAIYPTNGMPARADRNLELTSNTP